MNDQPRRLKGSLVERAARHFHYDMPDLPLDSGPQAIQRAAPTAAYPDVAPAPPSLAYPEYPPAPQLAARISPEAELPRQSFNTGRRQAVVDRKVLADKGMLVPGAPVSVLAEEFRLVKRQLLLTQRAVEAKDSDRARMILVCSAKPDEGKTFCAINLALSMAAEKDMEILLVDADFAKPDVLDRMGIESGLGLLDALSGAVANVEDLIVETDVPQLVVLPAGTKSHMDTELLASDRARAILDGLARANPRRIVIFDSPPALAASPASVLALHAGQVMLVVRADMTTESELREAVSLLDGCEHIQLVLNSVSYQLGGRRFGTYYQEVGK